MDSALRLTGDQHEKLRRHLFPGDGKEAVALVLCGRLKGVAATILCAHEILPIPHNICRTREPDMVFWPPDYGRDLYAKASAKSMAVLKMHSHPGGFDRFSQQDNRSDTELFASLHSWTDDGLPHASAVMLPDGRIFGRLVDQNGGMRPIDRVSVAGDEIRFYDAASPAKADETQLRTAQTFGDGTTALLRTLTVGVVGCSGTGSWVIEQLVRLGVANVVIVDPDKIERKNLNRIVNSREEDAKSKRKKVAALCEVLAGHGTGSVVTPIDELLFDEQTARSLAACDILFGCMDRFDGRDRLNRIAAIYLVPYIDVGVRLDADGQGGITNVSGVVNFLIPDGSSLLSRGCYSSETLRIDVLRRTNPKQFESELAEGYIKNAKVDSPAVISVNGFCASMAVNEMLARIHPFRSANLNEERRQQFDLVNSFWMQLPDSPPCSVLAKLAGRGDMIPFLNCVDEI